MILNQGAIVVNTWFTNAWLDVALYNGRTILKYSTVYTYVQWGHYWLHVTVALMMTTGTWSVNIAQPRTSFPINLYKAKEVSY